MLRILMFLTISRLDMLAPDEFIQISWIWSALSVRKCHFGVMVQVFIGNLFAVIGLDSGFTDGWPFKVFAQMLSLCFDDSRSYNGVIFQKEFPPISVVEENLLMSDLFVQICVKHARILKVRY